MAAAPFSVQTPPTVAIAIDSAAVRGAVAAALAASLRYQAITFDCAAVAQGTWGWACPAGGLAAVVASADAVLAYRRRRGGRANQWPIVLVTSEDELEVHRLAVAAADGVLLTRRVAELLATAVVLSAHQLSVMPPHEWGNAAAEVALSGGLVAPAAAVTAPRYAT